MREPGDNVPPELLPEVSAEIRVVCVDGDDLVQPPGILAPGLERRPVGAAAAAGHCGRWPGRRLPRPPPAAVDDLLLGGRRPGARRVGLAAADHVHRHRRDPRGGLARAHRTRRRAGHAVRRAAGAGPALDRGVRRARVPVPGRPPRRRDLARRARSGPGGAGDGRERRPGGVEHGLRLPAVRAAAFGRAPGGPALGAARPAGPLPGAGGRGDLPAVLGRPAPALPGQPLHVRRRAVPRGLLPLRLGRRRVRLLGGHRPRRELHRLPVVEHPEDRRPTARARALRAAVRVRVDVGRARPPERHLRRRRPRRADLLGVRRGQHHAGRPVARARRTPGLPRDHHSAPPRVGDGAQRLGLPRSPVQPARRGVPGLPRATTSRRCASGRTPTAPRPARS